MDKDPVFSSYQSSWTVWRYQHYIRDCEQKIRTLEAEIEIIKQKLEYLHAHPPLVEHFNWSA